MTRGKRGLFAVGNPGGPGRPARQTEREYLTATARACSLSDWEEIVVRAVADAKQGDGKAREWLAGYLLGATRDRFTSLTQIAVEVEGGVDPVKKQAAEQQATADFFASVR